MQTWRRTAFLVLDLPIGLITFIPIVVGLSLTLGLAVTFVLAVPVLWATLAMSRGLAAMERSRAAALLDVELRPPHSPLNSAPTSGSGWWAGVRYRATEGASWREVGHHVLMLPIGCITFSLATVAWAVPLLLCLLPILVHWLPGRYAAIGSVHVHEGPQVLSALTLGLLLLPGTPYFIGWLTALRTAEMRRLLSVDSETQRLRERVGSLESSRSGLVDAVDAERRRIERDLHDGAQQRLVGLAMDLGMVRQKLDEASGVDPHVRSLIDAAHIEAKRAIVELRDVARGVHPAILEDRGLDAALSSLAARCPVPMRLDVDIVLRPPRAIEAVAYYVVAEALTNVAKHAQASSVTVAVARRGDRLAVEVTDDGCGGAVVGATGGLGGGLAGLGDRVASVDGWFTVLSPLGGPTVLMAELPCGS